MNRQPAAVIEFEDDDFEQVARAIGTEQQGAARFIVSFLKRIAGKRMLDRVNNVFVSDAVLARRAVNLHTALM
ncbi:MAG TPA: hypothetical protein VIJ70_01585 [Gaiellaceae bacterium]